MKARYHIRNTTHFAEFASSPTGRELAQAFRANHPEFKRRHIRHIIQTHPDQIPLGEKLKLS